MTTNRLVLGLLAVALIGCGGARSSGSGSGPSEYTRQVQTYLGRISDNAKKQGYKRVVAGPVFGSLDDDEETSHEMTVNRGTDYVLFGACDNDCRDLDILVYDPDGDLVRRDVAADDNPVVVFTAAMAGKHRVKVVMADCRTEPCRYGLQLNAK